LAETNPPETRTNSNHPAAAGQRTRKGGGNAMKNRIIILGVSLLFLLPAVLQAAEHGSQEEIIQEAAEEIYALIMCPLCAGQTIGQSSNETSLQMRALVLKKLRQGETREEILQYFKARYGERILAKPTKEGFNLILWLFPFVSVFLAAGVVYLLIRRWSARTKATSAAGVDEDRFSEYEERLEKELKQFEEG
jgi:cytochrome c-type biogenesis protein CcmH